MNDNENFAGNPADGYLYSSTSREIPQEESSQAADTQIRFSKLVDDIAKKFKNLPYHQSQSPSMAHAGHMPNPDVIIEDNMTFVNKESSDFLDSDMTRYLPQENSPQASGSAILSSKYEERVRSRNENAPSLQSQPFITRETIVPLSEDTMNDNAVFHRKRVQQDTSTRDAVINDLSSCGGNSEKLFKNKLLSNEHIEFIPWTNENLFSRQSENLKDRSNEYTHIKSGAPLDKSEKEIANKSLAISCEELYFTVDPSLNDISLEYMKVYSESSTENYDFAMNIMACIELLNDGSWNATCSYFDGNIKRVIKYIWNELKSDSKCDIVLETFHREMYKDLMVQFTESCLNSKYDLGEFLTYCVVMCKLGVIARKRNFEEAPLLVIDLLRNSIQNLQLNDCFPDTFENTVKEYAQKLYIRDLFPFMAGVRNEIINANNGTFNRAPGGRPDLGTSRRFPQVTIPQSPQAGSSKPIGEMASRSENLAYIGSQLPFMTHAENVPTSEVVFSTKEDFNNKTLSELKYAKDDIPSREQIKNDLSVNRLPLSDQIEDTRKSMELLFSEENEVLRKKDDRILSNRRIGLSTENELLSSGREENTNIACGAPIDAHIAGITNICLAPNDVNNPQGENSYFTVDLLLEYRKLYFETLPENYDFAMNIMAYIEFLNDCSWKATATYFDENVKRVVKYMWNESKSGSKWDTVLQASHRKIFLDSMVQYTESCLSGKYDLGEFLKYCVEMCQLGVIARNRNFMAAPLRVIGFLRNSIRRLKLKACLADTFENIVKEHAQKLVECSMI